MSSHTTCTNRGRDHIWMLKTHRMRNNACHGSSDRMNIEDSDMYEHLVCSFVCVTKNIHEMSACIFKKREIEFPPTYHQVNPEKRYTRVAQMGVVQFSARCRHCSNRYI